VNIFVLIFDIILLLTWIAGNIIIILHLAVISKIDAFFDINLIIILLHLFMQICLFILNDLLQLMLNVINTLDDLLNAINLFIDFFGIITYLSSLMQHLLQQLFLHSLRIIANDLDHYVFERFNLFMFLFVVLDNVIFVLFV